jgi:transcriptional regulator with XRE-family HTH domain
VAVQRTTLNPRARRPVDFYVGEQIRVRRLSLGRTQQDVARAVGVTSQTLQKYEMGTHRISAARLKSIAETLGVSVGSFFQGLPGAPLAEPRYAEADVFELVRVFYAMPQHLHRAVLQIMIMKMLAEPPKR